MPDTYRVIIIETDVFGLSNKKSVQANITKFSAHTILAMGIRCTQRIIKLKSSDFCHKLYYSTMHAADQVKQLKKL